MSETAKPLLLSNRRSILVAVCLALILVTAIAVPFVTPICTECAEASNLAPVPGLHVIGAVFYSVLLAAMVRFGLTSWIAKSISFAAGIHLALIVVLVINHVTCIPCLLSLIFVWVAGITAIPKHSVKAAGLSTLTGFLICAAVFEVQRCRMQMEVHDITRKAIGFSKWPKESTGPIAITVFYAEKCKKCKVYRQVMLTQAQQRYGKDISIKFCLNPSAMMVPTTVVGGDEPTLLIGTPSWNALSNAIETSIARRRKRTQDATKSGVTL